MALSSHAPSGPSFLGQDLSASCRVFGWAPQRRLGLLTLQSTLGAWVITQDQNLGCLLTDWKLLLCHPFLHGPQLSHLYDGAIIITELKVYSFHFLGGSLRRVLLLGGLERFRDLPKVTDPAEPTGRTGF